MASFSTEPIVLASRSAARQSLLTNAGITFDAVAPAIDEDELKLSFRTAGMAPVEVCEALAELKATRISPSQPGRLVLGVDQMLVHDGEWLDKPTDADAARVQLKRLSGQSHELLVYAVIALNGSRIWHHHEKARLTMRPLSDAFIERYLDAMGDEVTETVGGYKLEGRGIHLFSRILGDYFTILGLPMLAILDFLRIRGVLDS